MKKNKAYISIFLIIVLMVIMVPQPVQSESDISVSARTAILMEQSSGRVLYGKDIHEKRRIASITKVMTAILAIESGELDEKVKISPNAYGTEGSSIYLKEGEKIALRDLVYGLMLRSGNDAAVAIAEYVGGSVTGFVELMNEKARELGMLDTHFANPHGLDDHENHYSTAYDMALLTKYAMKNKTFRKVFSTKRHSAPNPNEKWARSWKNKNKLLFRYPYSTGGKTGYTERANRTLISTASKDDMDLIVVTLDDSKDWEDHMDLFNYGFNEYDMVTIVEKGKVEHIQNDFYKGHLYTKRTLDVPVTDEEQASLQTKLTLIEPPKKGKWRSVPIPVGLLSLYIEDEKFQTLPLFYKGTEESGGFWSFVEDIFLGVLEFDL